MTGTVDESLRALLSVPVSATRDGPRRDLIVWIDTAFNGGLVVPRNRIAELGLVAGTLSEAILADGSKIVLETFTCFLDWFGETYETQIIASEGELPRLGTLLLSGHRLVIDYAEKTVELD